MMKPQFLIIGATVLLCGLAAAYDMVSGPQAVMVADEAVLSPVKGASDGAVVPDFAVTDLKGVSHHISDYRGRVVLLNFWATWCAPCLQEFPSMVSLVKAMEGRAVLLAVAMNEHESDVTQFLAKVGAANVPGVVVGLDAEGKISHGLFMTERFPETIIVAPDGTMARKVVGGIEWDAPDMLDYLKGLSKP
ncbi:MAG: TlpA family protein disulfide reductase [Alphaproteobacteria bacterium]|nr:TlpA family protein disulfide reductase [Alphaproteobacteria bacterium]